MSLGPLVQGYTDHFSGNRFIWTGWSILLALFSTWSFPFPKTNPLSEQPNDNLKTETPINHYFRFEWRSGSERKEDWFTKSISLNNNRLLIVYVNSDGLSSFIIILGNFGDESWICIFGLTHAGSWITMMNQKISNNPFKNSLSEPVHSTKEIILAL